MNLAQALNHRLYWLVLSWLSILVMVVSPVSAAPSLSVGNHTSYDLSGLMQATETCTADPATYATQACGFGGPPPQVPFMVFWIDNGTCTVNSDSCSFGPDVLDIPTGSSVQWVHSGTLTHTATSNTTANYGLPSFDSGPVPPGLTFTNVFSVPGTYHYYCAIHPWMKAVVTVRGSPTLPPLSMPPSFSLYLDGNLGWTVRGLSSDVANLKVDHRVQVSILPLPGVTFTPLVERGSFDQTVTLATRVESPGTATSIIQALFRSLPLYYLGAPVFTTGSVSSITSTNSVTAAALSRMSALLSDPDRPVYTMWWVNGPLSLGSPVQILAGWSSVTGDETLDLRDIGSRAGWVVTSQFSQTVNTTSPEGSSSNISFALNLLWSFDKRSDLLLRDSVAASFAVVSVNREQIFLGDPCAPTGYCPNFAPVTVTRTLNVTLNLALRLVNTDLNLDHKTNRGSAQSSFLDMMASTPLLPFGVIGAAAAGLVAVTVWTVRGRRARSLEVGAPPIPG